MDGRDGGRELRRYLRVTMRRQSQSKVQNYAIANSLVFLLVVKRTSRSIGMRRSCRVTCRESPRERDLCSHN